MVVCLHMDIASSCIFVQSVLVHEPTVRLGELPRQREPALYRNSVTWNRSLIKSRVSLARMNSHLGSDVCSRRRSGEVRKVVLDGSSTVRILDRGDASWI